MQVYRGMDIGTAKVPPSERLVTHYGIDLVDPNEPFSAVAFQRYGRGVITKLTADREKPPVLCGGTGLYLRAVMDAFEFPGVSEDEESGRNEARDRYMAYAQAQGEAALHAMLAERDPESAALIHPHNVRRVVRALELWEAGECYAQRSQGFSERKSYYPTRWIALDCQRDELYRRIDERVELMMETGLLDEVARLLAAGYREALTAAQAIGYKELVPVLEQGAALSEAIAAIKQATRRYAKRQLSWFRADPRVEWTHVDGRTPREIVDEIEGRADGL